MRRTTDQDERRNLWYERRCLNEPAIWRGDLPRQLDLQDSWPCEQSATRKLCKRIPASHGLADIVQFGSSRIRKLEEIGG
jgi:hypothetical protein